MFSPTIFFSSVIVQTLLDGSKTFQFSRVFQSIVYDIINFSSNINSFSIVHTFHEYNLNVNLLASVGAFGPSLLTSPSYPFPPLCLSIFDDVLLPMNQCLTVVVVFVRFNFCFSYALIFFICLSFFFLFVMDGYVCFFFFI